MFHSKETCLLSPTCYCVVAMTHSRSYIKRTARDESHLGKPQRHRGNDFHIGLVCVRACREMRVMLNCAEVHRLYYLTYAHIAKHALSNNIAPRAVPIPWRCLSQATFFLVVQQREASDVVTHMTIFSHDI